MAIVFWIFTGGLSALGLVEAFRRLTLWLTRPRRPGALTLVALVRDWQECEALVTGGMQRLAWLDGKGPQRLLCVDATGDPRAGPALEVLRRRYPALDLCKTGDLVYHILQSETRE